MRHRRIDALMTREVVSVRGDAPFKEIVRILAQHLVTAVPAIERMCATVDGVVSVSATRLAYERNDSSSEGGRS
ncbi:hypothetical protein [Streptomyces sp. NPDC004788]